MAASFLELLRNKTFATDVDGSGVHTLHVTPGSAGSAGFFEIDRNPELATDETAGVHTLQFVAGTPGDDSFIELARNAKIAGDYDVNNRFTLHLIIV